MMTMKRQCCLALFFLAGSISLASCSSGTSSSSSTTSLPSGKAGQHTLRPIGATSVVINGKTVMVPREEYSPNRPTNGLFDNGQQVIITADGVLPRQLNAPTPATITWTNLSSKQVGLLLVAQGVRPVIHQIPAGTRYSLAFPGKGAVVVNYITTTRYNGSVTVGGMPLTPLTSTTVSAKS